MKYICAMEKRDYARIDKLDKLNDIETYNEDVRKLTSKVTNDHTIHRWECLAGIRATELELKHTFEKAEYVAKCEGRNTYVFIKRDLCNEARYSFWDTGRNESALEGGYHLEYVFTPDCEWGEWKRKWGDAEIWYDFA